MKLPLLLLLGAGPAAAAGPPIGCEAAARAAVADLEARAATVQRAAARAASAVDRWPDPEIRGRTGAPGPLESTRVGVRVNLPVPGVGGAAAEAWRARGEVAVAEDAAAAVERAAEARRAHLAVRRARARLTWAQEAAERAATRLGGVRAQVEAGLATAVGLAQEALDVDAAGDAVADARHALAIAEAELAALVDGAVADDAPCAPPEAGDAPPPGVRAAQADVARAEAERRAEAAQASWWPRFVEIAWDQVQVDAGRVLVSVGVPLPLFGDEGAAGAADEVLARRALGDAERRQETRLAAARARLAAADAHVAALAARAAPPEAAITADVARLRPDAADTVGLQEALARRAQRRAEAAFEREAAAIEVSRLAGALP
ncbi:MAG: TolC family protein [bacterium]